MLDRIEYCPWVENYVPVEVWKEIWYLVEYVRSTPIVTTGLTHYELLNSSKVTIYSWED